MTDWRARFLVLPDSSFLASGYSGFRRQEMQSVGYLPAMRAETHSCSEASVSEGHITLCLAHLMSSGLEIVFLAIHALGFVMRPWH